MSFYFDDLSNIILLFSAYQLSRTGQGTKKHQADALGLFEFVPGILKEGGPVYRQAHSHQKIPNKYDYQLYRWETLPPPQTFSDLETSGTFGVQLKMGDTYH